MSSLWKASTIAFERESERIITMSKKEWKLEKNTERGGIKRILWTMDDKYDVTHIELQWISLHQKWGNISWVQSILQLEPCFFSINIESVSKLFVYV